MFFEIENDVLVPTLYAMWQIPELLPYFTTLSAVLKNLINGADLMLPGVIPQGTGMNIYGHYKKDQLVGINLSTNKAAVGVGMLLRSSNDLYMSGGRGQAVKILHIFGDKLWAHEPGMTQQIPLQEAHELQTDDFPELGTSGRKENVANSTTAQRQESKLNEAIEDMNLQTHDDNVNSEIITNTIENDKDVTLEQTLKNAFLAALKNSGKSLALPLLTSNFYRLYVVPEAPQSFDLKKTRYKKLSNFLKEMMDEEFLVVREENKGVDKITSINLSHPEVVNFITDFKTKPNVDVDGNEEQPLFHSSLTEMYVVTDATAAFFTKMNFKRGEGIPGTQLNHIIREYISKYELKLADAGTRAVHLDEVLQQLCACTQATTKEICVAVTSKMQHTYQMCSTKDTSNNKPCIQMSLATRSGNKKVTLVSNIESYGIILSEFIKLCKQGAAASTTVVKLPHQKRDQLQIQGNQIRFVFNLLTETYKVPPKCILGMELAVKEKKKAKKK